MAMAMHHGFHPAHPLLNSSHVLFSTYPPAVSHPRHAPIFQPHPQSSFPHQTPPYTTQPHAHGFEFSQLPPIMGGDNRGSDPQSAFRARSQSHVMPNPQYPQTRGPPRKPRQSGHALWVGNLPLGATIVQLKDHFSMQATDDIESVKLISKSHCAFVNYKTQAACNAAVQRFNERTFLSVPLVCRLRRTSASYTAAPSQQSSRSEPTQSKVDAKYFILKSLTIQDLEESIQDSIWATQSHNENALNAAYKTAENVYLIFSANKSGEYFGYARMESPIPAPDLDEAELLSRRLPFASAVPQATSSSGESSTAQHLEPSDTIPPSGPRFPTRYAAPRSIPTPATEWAPKGRIIDDIARETIFWEADEADQEQRQQQQHAAETVHVAQAYAQQTAVAPQSANETVESTLADSPPSNATSSESSTQQSVVPVIAHSSIDMLPSPALEAPPEAPSDAPPSARVENSSKAQVQSSADGHSIATPRVEEQLNSPPASTAANTNPQKLETQHSHEPQPLGNPFRISWQSTKRVPFWRTRGLKNSLNGYREVKIARDGTEVEASVAERLLLLFAVPKPGKKASSPPTDDDAA